MNYELWYLYGILSVTSCRRDFEYDFGFIRVDNALNPFTNHQITAKMTSIMQRFFIDPTLQQPPTRDLPRAVVLPDTLPTPKETKYHPTDGGNENGSVFFVGNATVIMFVDMIFSAILGG